MTINVFRANTPGDIDGVEENGKVKDCPISPAS